MIRFLKKNPSIIHIVITILKGKGKRGANSNDLPMELLIFSIKRVIADDRKYERSLIKMG